MITFCFESWQWVNIGQYLISIVFVLGIYFTVQTAKFCLEKEMTWEVLSFSRSETSGRYKVLPVGVAIRCVRSPTPTPKEKGPSDQPMSLWLNLTDVQDEYEAVFQKPVTTSGKKPKLIVTPHGGPHSNFNSNFSLYNACLCKLGFAVLGGDDLKIMILLSHSATHTFWLPLFFLHFYLLCTECCDASLV